MGRAAIWMVGAALLIGGGLYLFRVDLMLFAISVGADQRGEIGPYEPVPWTQGPELPAPGPRPPNVILIVADDLGWNDLTFNGGGIAEGTVPTRAIDSIAAAGASFRNGYAGQGTCAPSRAMLMTGRYGSRFGFEFTPTPAGMSTALGLMQQGAKPASITLEPERTIPYEAMGLPASEITLAELLRAEGYYTAHVGKWHLGRDNGSAPQDQGFDQSLLMHSGLYGEEDDPAVVHAKLPWDPIDRFLWAGMRFAASYNGGVAFKPPRYLTDYYTQEAVKVIERNRHRPFFLYLAHWAPHTPLQASAEDYAALDHIDDHVERVYASMIRALDRGVGQVLDTLRRLDLEENTLVIFTSDNGGAGYVGIDDVNKPFRGFKITNFEGGIHVPYFVKWPAQVPSGVAVDAPVHHFDIFATVADAAGARIERMIDGVSLLPYATGETLPPPHETLFWRAGAYQTVRHQHWKLAVDPIGDQRWLFDLAEDPEESRNLVEEHPELVSKMLDLLAAHNAEMVPPLWEPSAAAPINIDKHRRQTMDPSQDSYVYWSN